LAIQEGRTFENGGGRGPKEQFSTKRLLVRSQCPLIYQQEVLGGTVSSRGIPKSSAGKGCCYHLSKFHIYALIYGIGVFLSDLLHSV